MYNPETKCKVLQLKENGLTDSQISRELKVSRSYVRDCVNGYKYQRIGSQKQLRTITDLKTVCASDYAYILGLYLAVGYINKQSRTYKIRISLGIKHPLIIERCIKALKKLYPDNSVHCVNKGSSKALDVYVHSNTIPKLFPQHAVGKKHDRLIELTDWQREIIDNNSAHFITGLFDGDGCSYIQTKTTTTYHQFTNNAIDILNLFLEYTEKNNIKGILTSKGKMYNIFIRVKEDRDRFQQLINNTRHELDNLNSFDI